MVLMLILPSDEDLVVILINEKSGFWKINDAALCQRSADMIIGRGVGVLVGLTVLKDFVVEVLLLIMFEELTEFDIELDWLV